MTSDTSIYDIFYFRYGILMKHYGAIETFLLFLIDIIIKHWSLNENFQN